MAHLHSNALLNCQKRLASADFKHDFKLKLEHGASAQQRPQRAINLTQHRMEVARDQLPTGD
jgi:hypothetical protein